METLQELENLKITRKADFKKVSIVIPVYNEKRTIESVIDIVKKAPVLGLSKQIILVDDCSKDGTTEILQKLAEPSVKTLFLEKNIGKSGALAFGLKQAEGDIIIVQDADLEYDPFEYEILLKPFIYDNADVVYGSRYLQNNVRQIQKFWHTFFNKIFTYYTNALCNRYFSDVQTCYKVFNKKVLNQVGLNLQSKRFGFDPEFTAAISRKPFKIIEVPISYYPRGHKAGKHMGITDALKCTWLAFWFNIVKKS